MATYDPVTGGKTKYKECPYGMLLESSTVYEWIEDGSDRTIFLHRSDTSQFPGTTECGSDYFNVETDLLKHKWHQSDLPVPDMTDHEPYGPVDGTESFHAEISTSGASVGWEYNQPDVSRDDVSSSDELELNWIYNDGDHQSASHVWKVGSECEFKRGSEPGYNDTLLTLNTTHTFSNKLGWKELYLTSGFSYE